MAQATRTQTSPRNLPSVTGFAIAALMGALSTLTAVLLWAFFAVIFSRLEVSTPLGWALLSGLVIGLTLSAMRKEENRKQTTPLWFALAVGAGVGVLWLVFTGLRPLGFGEVSVLWGVIGAPLAFCAAAFLTRYGLRDLNLAEAGSNIYETITLRLLRGFGFIFFISVVVFPFYFMVASSLKSRSTFLQDPTNLSIDFSQGLGNLLVGYREVLVRFDFARYILNSTIVAVATVIITLLLAVLGAYAVTRLRFPGRDMLSRSILLIYMFPAIVLVVPLYAVFTQIGLRDTLPGLLVVYPATTIPVALYMLRSYFQTLPKDLEEAGMIDGCTRLGVIWRITLPLSVPALASVGLYVFMIAWNEFLFAFMFLDSPEIFTLSRGMVALNSQEVPRQFLMAGAVIVTVPIMVLFFWFEKYLVGGLTAGGVKE